MANTILLRNGRAMPPVGMTTTAGREAEIWCSLPASFEQGARRYCSSSSHGSLRALGTFLGESFQRGVLRSDMWVSASVGPGVVQYSEFSDCSSTNLKHKARMQIENSLDQLMLGYVDLLLMDLEDPSDEVRQQVWEVLEEYYFVGRAKAVGLRSSSWRHLAGLLKDANVAPMVVQLDCGPSRAHPELMKLCQQNGIILEVPSSAESASRSILSGVSAPTSDVLIPFLAQFSYGSELNSGHSFL
mmetsp:Transcript_43227/g.65432  ORF Transcript_43227/g.65432 Transcript_43227/m.65432 type:complete len:244 (+) Transcript_43227:96-827(+)